MMVLLSGSEAVIGRLKSDMGELTRQTSLRGELVAAQDLPQPAAPGALPFRLTGHGIDQPGLVHRIAHLLRGLQVNIESLDTRLKPAPYTGAPVFEMELILAIPRTTSLSQLRQNLSALCDELNIDWELEPA